MTSEQATAAPAARDATDAPGLVQRVVSLAQRYAPWLLAFVVSVVYAPSLPGDLLTYDDAWLIEQNAVLHTAPGEALRAILSDLSVPTRLALGAEYLPLRDLSYYFDVAVLGLGPRGMRVEQLLFYLAAVLCVRAALLGCLQDRARAEVASACFALHPVHVESVAWLAGRKDVLALVFIAAAFVAYQRRSAWGWLTVPLLAGAYFSKSMSVIAPGLLLGFDLLAQRRPRWGVLAAGVGAAVPAVALHLIVGRRVSMVGGPLAGDAWLAFCTMGEVWLEYLKVLAWPPALSLVHEVPRAVGLSSASVLGWCLLGGSGALGVVLLRRGKPLCLAAWLWIVLPLAPVSQVGFPLQNVMADRYLWLSTLGVGLALGWVWGAHRLGTFGAGAAALSFAASTAWRAEQFGDAALLFSREVHITQGALAPYLLGETMERNGDASAARDAYRLATERPCDAPCEPARRSSNALARLLATSGDPESAEAVLRAAVERFPNDPKVHFNLVKVLVRVGKTEEAQRLFEQSRARFPDYKSTGERRPHL